MAVSKLGIQVVKASGDTESFDPNVITTECVEAGIEFWTAAEVALEVSKRIYDGISSDAIHKATIEALYKKNPEAAETYKRFHNMNVRTSDNLIETFDKKKIARSLIKETKLPKEVAEVIAKETEAELRRLKLEFASGPLIREVVNVKLLEHGFESARADYTRLGMPVYDVTGLINVGSKENANLQHNPETVHKLVADQVFKEYNLLKILPLHLADAHMKGEIHIHDLDYFSTRPFCFSHDLRFFLKNGYKADGEGFHTAVAKPAKHVNVAILHAAKVLASAQTNCAGGQGYNWFNILLAPYLVGMKYEEMKQIAQMFIYEMSQMYVARGGQTVFSSIDIEPGIPKVIEDIPAVLPGGIVKKRVTYSDFHDESNMFFNALLDVYMGGDGVGKPFNFPKLEAKVYKEDFKKYPEEMMKLAELTAKFGTPYYFIQQDYLPEYACYQCCSFLMPLSEQNTNDDLVNGTVRGGSLQVGTVNLPRIAYEANGDDTRLFELLRERMDFIKEMMLIKQDVIRARLDQGLLPFLAQPVDDAGTPYLLVDTQGLEIGMVGLNEMLKIHTDEELHDSDNAWRFGLNTIQKMGQIASEFKEETGYMFGLSRTPAESSGHRLAKIDLAKYGANKAVVQGDTESGGVYYSNSVHVNVAAEIPLFKRLQMEGAFHPLLDGGAMSHVWLGEAYPDPETLNKMTERIVMKTLISYFSYTKDFTMCKDCNGVFSGLLDKCSRCGSEKIDWYSRITGYYQNVSGWNEGKKQELKNRYRTNISGGSI
ncbi:MAG: anaerobic ribonucleoside-triphosphate reductase [Candidatus Hydrothermarchaeales archaeon]